MDVDADNALLDDPGFEARLNTSWRSVEEMEADRESVWEASLLRNEVLRDRDEDRRRRRRAGVLEGDVEEETMRDASSEVDMEVDMEIDGAM